MSIKKDSPRINVIVGTDLYMTAFTPANQTLVDEVLFGKKYHPSAFVRFEGCYGEFIVLKVGRIDGAVIWSEEAITLSNEEKLQEKLEEAI